MSMQPSSMFPLLQCYDKCIGLSIVGYFGMLRAIRLDQGKLSAVASQSHKETEQWVSRISVVQLYLCR